MRHRPRRRRSCPSLYQLLYPLDNTGSSHRRSCGRPNTPRRRVGAGGYRAPPPLPAQPSDRRRRVSTSGRPRGPTLSAAAVTTRRHPPPPPSFYPGLSSSPAPPHPPPTRCHATGAHNLSTASPTSSPASPLRVDPPHPTNGQLQTLPPPPPANPLCPAGERAFPHPRLAPLRPAPLSPAPPCLARAAFTASRVQRSRW